MAGTGDDETSEGPPPRPSPPKRKRESVVIEGRASEAGPLGASAAAPQGGLAVGALGGVIGAALALVGVWLFAARPDLAPLDRRMAALEAATEAAKARMAAFEAGAKSATDERRALAERLNAIPDAEAKLSSRVSALEAAARDVQASVETLKRDDAQQGKNAADAESALEKRLATLEGVALRADSLQAVAAEARAAKNAADKALAAAGAPSADPRLDRLAADEAEIAALRASLDKLAAPKTESRVSPAARTATTDRSPAARAVAAMALQSGLAAGEPLGAPLAALDRLGVEAKALAPLRPYAETGAPTLAALARALAQAAPAQNAGPAQGGVAQRLLGEVQGLVKVRKVGESRPSGADLSQVEAALGAGDLARALEAFGDLPPAAQAAARNWRESAEARLAADRAAEALVGRAVADLGAGR